MVVPHPYIHTIQWLDYFIYIKLKKKKNKCIF